MTGHNLLPRISKNASALRGMMHVPDNAILSTVQRQIGTVPRNHQGRMYSSWCPAFLDDTRRMVEGFINHYNKVQTAQRYRLHRSGGQIERQKPGNIPRARPKTGKSPGAKKEKNDFAPFVPTSPRGDITNPHTP